METKIDTADCDIWIQMMEGYGQQNVLGWHNDSLLEDAVEFGSRENNDPLVGRIWSKSVKLIENEVLG